MDGRDVGHEDCLAGVKPILMLWLVELHDHASVCDGVHPTKIVCDEAISLRYEQIFCSPSTSSAWKREGLLQSKFHRLLPRRTMPNSFLDLAWLVFAFREERFGESGYSQFRLHRLR